MRFLLVGRNTRADPKQSVAAKDGWVVAMRGWQMWVAGKIFKVWLFQSVLSWKKLVNCLMQGTLHLSSTLYCDSDLWVFIQSLFHGAHLKTPNVGLKNLQVLPKVKEGRT